MVEISVSSDDVFPDSMMGIVILSGCHDGREDVGRSVPVAEEETDLGHISSPLVYRVYT